MAKKKSGSTKRHGSVQQFKGLRTVKECDAQEWRDERLSIYSGNLKRGAKVRELRSDLQVTLTEVADYLWEEGPAEVPANISCISKIERGLRAMTVEEYTVLVMAIKQCGKGERSRARRHLRSRRRKMQEEVA